MPNNEAAAMTPFSVAPKANSFAISGKATPVVKTTMPSKNLPAAASHQMNHCILVMGPWWTGVASAQTGVSSMYSWTLLPDPSVGIGGLLSGGMGEAEFIRVRFRKDCAEERRGRRRRGDSFGEWPLGRKSIYPRVGWLGRWGPICPYRKVERRA